MPSLSDPGAAEREASHVCPLCAHAEADRRALYVHLQISHRKSELSEALLSSSDAEGDRSPTE